jgi:DNA-binding MarR family transcriptional regulator
MASDDKSRGIGESMARVARLHRARSASLLGEAGLYPGQDRALDILSDGAAVSMSTLATAMQVRPPTASKMIGRLLQQGLVSRAESADDARRVLVKISDEGLRRHGRLAEIGERLEREMTEGFDAKDRRRFRKLLRRAASNLSAAQGNAPLALPDLDEDIAAPAESL